ncbi:hypothetical protein BDW75DRAFT_224466 [Aspergillus navahoensis]
MTFKHPSRPRLYRNLQTLKEKYASTIVDLKSATSALSVSDTRSQFSTHSVDLTMYQHPSPQPHSTPHTIERPSAPTRNATGDTISCSQSQIHPRPSFDSLPASPPSKTTNNPATSLLTLTTHIQTQSTQARHLFTQVSHLLSVVEREWIDSTISDTENATREILRLTESYRVDQAVNNGSVGVMSQLRWLVHDSRRAREKREQLVLCHSSLLGVLGWLQGLSLHGLKSGQLSSVQEGELPVGLSRATTQATGYGCEGGTVISSVSPSLETYGSESMSKSGTRHRPDSPAWDLSVQLQDAGMEVVVPKSGREPEPEPEHEHEPEHEPEPETRPKSEHEPGAQPGLLSVKVPMQSQDVSSSSLDDELLDMLSWRWTQGRQTQE